MWNSKKGIKIEDIIELHNQGFSPIKIAEKLNCDITNISKRLISENIKPNRTKNTWYRKNRYNIDLSYFEKIDTPNKAYVLGIMYSDGCVTKNGFYIKMKDEDVLLNIKKELQADQQIKIANNGNYWAYRLSICSEKMSKDLINLGCYINKTYTLKFPTEEQVPSHLFPHFARGFFDGDGSLNINVNINSCRITFASAAFNFISVFKENISNFSKRKGSLIKGSGKNSNVWFLSFTGRQIFEILDWFYKDADIFMKRKYDKFLICKSVHLKQGELLENPTLERQKEDNQQPSLSSNTFEGSTTNSRVQNLDSNADTSALQFDIKYDRKIDLPNHIKVKY